MKSMIRPVEFYAPLSEVEVKMTLKELCGSTWHNYPFRGEVDKNAFRLTKNQNPFFRTKGVPKPTLKGNFVGEGQQTKVTVALHTSKTDIFKWLIFVLGIVFFAGYGFVSMLEQGFAAALLSAKIIGCFGLVLLAITYFLFWISFRRSVARIKKALGCL